MFFFCSIFTFPSRRFATSEWRQAMHLRHDLRLRMAASVIYEACYPAEEWAPMTFEEAERLETLPYLQAVEAALLARPIFSDRAEQLPLL
jgi:hypothetical protein